MENNIQYTSGIFYNLSLLYTPYKIEDHIEWIWNVKSNCREQISLWIQNYIVILLLIDKFQECLCRQCVQISLRIEIIWRQCLTILNSWVIFWTVLVSYCFSRISSSFFQNSSGLYFGVAGLNVLQCTSTFLAPLGITTCSLESSVIL